MNMTEKVFREKFRNYIADCKGGKPEKLANVAGFCVFCKISREEYAKMKALYPKMFDIAQATFFDEALNTKAVNSAQTMGFLHELVKKADGESGVEVSWEHGSADAE